MKKIITTALLLHSILGFSQEKKLKNGTYSAYNSGKEVNLLVSDNKIHLYVLSFDYSIDKDSVLSLKAERNPGFSLIYSKNNELPNDKLRVQISNVLVATKDLYIGSEIQNNQINYKSITKIKEKLQENEYKGQQNSHIVFDIEKTQSINLVYGNDYTLEAEVATFEIPKDINSIIINYVDKTDLFNVTGIYNDKNEELTLYNNGREPITFKYYKETNQEDAVKPVAIAIKKNLDFLGNERTTYETVSAAADTIASAAPAIPVKKFSHNKSATFKTALKTIAKKPKKFLVVAFDLKNKKRQTEFDEFIKNDELLLTDTYEYVQNKNQFDYYLATEKDKNLLAKHKIQSESEILVFNSKGELIYHTPESLKVNTALFSGYDTAYNEFEKANQQLKFDQILLSKKATNKTIVNLLNKKQDFQIVNINAIEPPPIVVVDKEPVTDGVADEIKASEEEINIKSTDSTMTMTDEEKKILSETFPPPVIEREPVYETYWDSYSIIKNPKNLYQLKTTLEIVTNRWEQIVTEFEKSKKIDFDFISVIKKELKDKGFSKTIFGKSSSKTLDFKMLNYVFDNYKTLSQEIEPQDKAADAVLPEIDNAGKAG